MRRPGLRALFGLICALAFGGQGADARPASAAPRSPRCRARQRAAGWVVHSPDRRHRVELVSGRVQLDGRALAGVAARPLGAPVWRHDSRALAFLQRGEAGLQLLVVLLDVDPLKPLIWSLPSTADASRMVFWIGPQRVGVGEKPLVPRLVVSWTTTLA